MAVTVVKMVINCALLIPKVGPEAFAFIRWLAEHHTQKASPILTTMYIEGDSDIFVILRMPGTYRDPATLEWTEQAANWINNKIKQDEQL